MKGQDAKICEALLFIECHSRIQMQCSVRTFALKNYHEHQLEVKV